MKSHILKWRHILYLHIIVLGAKRMLRGCTVKMSCGNIKYQNKNCEAIINAVGPDYRELMRHNDLTRTQLDRQLACCFDNILLTCEGEKLRSVAIPFISGRKKIKRFYQSILFGLCAVFTVCCYRLLFSFLTWEEIQQTASIVLILIKDLHDERAIVFFNRNLPTRCHKTSLRAFVGCFVHIQ